MIPIKTLIERARIMLKDTDDEQNSYKDDELLIYANSAIKFLKRSILRINPLYLVNFRNKFTLVAGDESVDIGARVSDVVMVYANGKKLHHINYLDVQDRTKTGTLEYFAMINNTSLLFYPIPEEDYEIEVYAIGDTPDVHIDGYTPFADDFDDFISEYMVSRALLGDEFNVSQEMSITQNIYRQIEEMINPSTDSFSAVKSY